MIQDKLNRINELARLQRERELTEAEREEQAQLRREYIAEWRNGVMQVLDNTYVVDKNGIKHKLQKKQPKS